MTIENNSLFSSLPVDMKLEILSHLSVEDITQKVSLVCKDLYHLSQNEDLWKKKTISKFGKTDSEKLFVKKKSWKLAYIESKNFIKFSNLKEIEHFKFKNFIEMNRVFQVKTFLNGIISLENVSIRHINSTHKIDGIPVGNDNNLKGFFEYTYLGKERIRIPEPKICEVTMEIPRYSNLEEFSNAVSKDKRLLKCIFRVTTSSNGVITIFNCIIAEGKLCGDLDGGDHDKANELKRDSQGKVIIPESQICEIRMKVK
jgi:hypothetical protein